MRTLSQYVNALKVMDRFSIHLERDGPVTSIRMESTLLGIPLFKVYAFFVDPLLIDTGFSNSRTGFLKVCKSLFRVETVVNTHHHEDHTGNNFWVMFCSYSGSIERPEEAIQRKVESLENLKREVEKGVKQGLLPREIRRKLLGKRDRYRLITAGEITKQNLINAFLK